MTARDGVATDLAPLRFTDRVAMKSSALPAVELIPEWDKAIESGHSGVRLVEVPLQSNTFSLYVESVIKSGKLLYQKRAFTRRRLVIARRSSGETDMFVITLMPVEISGKVWKIFAILVAVILPAGFSAPRWKVSS